MYLLYMEKNNTMREYEKGILRRLFELRGIG
jgi:hypothetical protein